MFKLNLINKLVLCTSLLIGLANRSVNISCILNSGYVYLFFAYWRLCNISRVSFDAKRAMSAIGLFQDLRQAILNPKY